MQGHFGQLHLIESIFLGIVRNWLLVEASCGSGRFIDHYLCLEL